MTWMAALSVGAGRTVKRGGRDLDRRAWTTGRERRGVRRSARLCCGRDPGRCLSQRAKHPPQAPVQPAPAAQAEQQAIRPRGVVDRDPQRHPRSLAGRLEMPADARPRARPGLGHADDRPGWVELGHAGAHGAPQAAWSVDPQQPAVAGSRRTGQAHHLDEAPGDPPVILQIPEIVEGDRRAGIDDAGHLERAGKEAVGHENSAQSMGLTCAASRFEGASMSATTDTQPTVVENYVNGRWTASPSGSWLDVTNPATGEVLARTAMSDRGEVEEAVAAARAALPGWRSLPVIARAQLLHRLRHELAAQAGELAACVTAEMGKTLADARAEVD